MNTSHILSCMTKAAQLKCVDGTPPAAPLEALTRVSIDQILASINCQVEVRFNTKACSLTELAQIRPGATVSYPLSALKYEVIPIKQK